MTISADKYEDTPECEKCITEQHRQQGDLIVKGFTSLMDRCEAARRLASTEEGAPFDRLDFKRELVAQLQSSIFPELRQHTNTLADLLQPDASLKGPTPKFDLLLEIQAGLHRTLEQIYSAVQNLCPGGDQAFFTGINDQHLKELKPYRLNGLYTEITMSFSDVYSALFGDFGELFHELKLSTGTGTPSADVASTRECILADVSDCHKVIDLATNWLEGSEFDIVQAPWVHEKYRISEMLETFMLLINRCPELRYRRAPLKPLSEPIIELARELIPVIKLLRLLFEKLSKRGMNKKRLPMYTNMVSDQLESVGKLVQQLVNDLERVKGAFCASSSVAEGETAHMLMSTVGAFKYRISNLFLLISVYFLPIVPDTDGSPTRNYYKSWLASWKASFIIAIDSFVDAAYAFQDEHY
ncbi:hypothetical protein Pst134EB_016160 [Puccinia striiformis f. sp. tritici]|uniref:Uncharacterized protein n=2 Tax=Puccinia striiformis TaxID=27350 RepID=A0A0L0VF83_9BASI|nr:hypothetical protein Pst134EB_016160 [Puccinia striiformis f. sp. tritici]KNE97654.1 hypothetical protein PSTG_09059 [Puccinia striiformis f. sp. tritici PST-78]POW02073.1 hypothetical protein PSTT_12061 [Puccinia striiformis]